MTSFSLLIRNQPMLITFQWELTIVQSICRRCILSAIYSRYSYIFDTNSAVIVLYLRLFLVNLMNYGYLLTTAIDYRRQFDFFDSHL